MRSLKEEGITRTMSNRRRDARYDLSVPRPGRSWGSTSRAHVNKADMRLDHHFSNKSIEEIPEETVE